MPPSTDQIKKNTRGEGRRVVVYCIGCGKGCGGMRYSDYPDNPYVTVVSKPLTSHINNNRNKTNPFCYDTYNNNGLVMETEKNIHYNFTTSRVTSGQEFIPVRQQIGLPTPVQNNYHRTINNYTIFSPGLDFDESIIESLLPEEHDECGENDTLDMDDSTAVALQRDHHANASNSTQNEAGPVNIPSTNQFIIDSEKKMFTVKPSSEQILVEVDLMNVMARHKTSLAAFESIWKWANRSQARSGFCFAAKEKPRRRETVIGDISRLATETNMNLDKFQPTDIEWLPSNKKVQLHVRDFSSALKCLLRNPSLVRECNLSFPDPKVPYIWRDFPEPSDDTEIKELHHGHWWVRSWKDAFKLKDKLQHFDDTEVKDILVPIIFYMDGISLDAHGRLNLMPLNMTLGIFSTEARKRAEAWETIYFHPNQTEVQLAHNSKKNVTTTHKCQNLHNGLHKALESFFQACTGEQEYIWHGLPYGGKKWKARMKFAIAYVVGDSELHDQLCGRKKGYSNTNIYCRHCNVSPENLVNPRKQLDAKNRKVKLWRPEDFDPSKPLSHFDEFSHHRITNAFDRLDFGCNPHKIHLATPGELLHMHQLGPAKRAVESYKAHVNHELGGDSKSQNKENLSYLELSSLAQIYGAYLSRQSDRDFPRTKFSSVHILRTSMKEGSHYAGILLCILLSVTSKYGADRYKSKRIGMSELQRLGLIETIELIIEIEEFLKKGGIKVGDLPRLKLVIEDFLHKINTNCKRNNNEENDFGLRLLKNHLYLHLVELIAYFGPPAGFDSSFQESHHKTEIKAPSKNTQCRASQLIKQTGTRQFELRLVRDATRHFLSSQPVVESTQPTPRFGPSFTIFRDEGTGLPKMVWSEKRHCRLPTHCDEVLSFCVDNILPIIKGDTLRGFTEHHRLGEENGLKYIYRAHPSFRSNVGLKCNVWYDWAKFNVEVESGQKVEFPGQINCFLEIGSDDFIEERETNGYWCVTREFSKPPSPIKGSDLVQRGQLDAGFSLRDCDTITDDVAVVPNILDRTGDDFVTGNDFFVVRNRNDWLRTFWTRVENAGKSGTKRKQSGGT